jgi:hypothetical protein
MPKQFKDFFYYYFFHSIVFNTYFYTSLIIFSYTSLFTSP